RTMTCAQVVRLFGAYWDDETTRAEREWVEAHLASCASCRHQYEAFTRTLELVGSLPRVEPAPDLLERVLSRARRATAAPDLVAASGAGVRTDSLFDHTEDVEFILDPVRLQRGRATVTKPPTIRGEKAVISF